MTGGTDPIDGTILTGYQTRAVSGTLNIAEDLQDEAIADDEMSSRPDENAHRDGHPQKKRRKERYHPGHLL